MTTRRKFLSVLGGGAIFAAAGTGTFLATRTPTKALAPWTMTSEYTDPRKRALAHALLAPNPHNRQPWLVALSGTDRITLYRDERRTLPMTDPFHRQLFIGLGAFTELMVIAASADGYAVDLDILPEGDAGPIFTATLRRHAETDPLAAHILNRRSTKTPFAPTPLSRPQVDALSNYAQIITQSDMIETLRQITWDAFQVETYTPHTYKESVELMRIGKAEINANPDGLEMTSPLWDALRNMGVLTNEMLLDTSNSAFQSFMADYEAMLRATPNYAVITTPTNTRADQIDAGRRWLRLNLKTTEMGLGVHPVSQALQEYEEMATHCAHIHELLAGPGETVQMLGRVGYGQGSDPTPRWALETRLLDG